MQTLKLNNPSSLFSIVLPLVWILGVLLFFITHPVITLAQEQDSTEDQVKQIETDLLQQKEQFLRFDSEERGLLDQLTDIDRVINEKKRLVKELRAKIDLNKEELKSKQQELIKIQDVIRKLEMLLHKRLVALYKYARRGYLQTLASANNLEELNKRMKYLKAIVDDDRRTMTQLAHEQTTYQNELAEIEKQLAIIVKMEDVETKGLTSIKEDLEKKVIVLAKIHQEKEFYQTAVKELESAALNLKNTLLNLDQDERKNKKLPKGFEEQKGKLPLPYEGKIIQDLKELGIESVKTQKGIYISGPLGGEVKAVFPGRVDFSGQLKGYGEVIVINHGSRFFTVSAYLLQRNKDENEMVSSGEVIGQLGRTGILTGPGMYFEIRKGDTPLDPMAWLEVH